MKRIFFLCALGALSASVAAAQTTASGQAAPKASPSSKASTSAAAPAKKTANAVTIADGTKIDVKLVSWLDAIRSRIGDPVEARIEQDVKQGGKVVLPNGTQLGGRVTASQTRTANRESQVGVAFERALLPSGVSIPLHASIVAISAPPVSTAAANDAALPGSAMAATPASARAAASGATVSTSNAAVSNATEATNATAHPSSSAVSPVKLSSNSKGVFGFDGLSLGSAKAGTPGSVITSNTKNVRLNSGTEMMLRTSTQAR